MIVTSRIAEARAQTADARAAGRSVGFVPTMGALHEGHLSLVRRARRENEVCVVSIFVNPTQFGPGEDLEAYPRPVADDIRACEQEGVDLVFNPDAAEIYPRPPETTIRVGALAEPMEGRYRPGHLEGVCLVVAKLLNVVGPCRAYFGEKDAQQLRVVRRMVEDLCFPVEVVGCPTVREADGLALSSRNTYLSGDERGRALCLHRALAAVREAVEAGELEVRKLRDLGLAELERGGADAVDYLELVHPESLEPVDEVRGEVLVCGAIRVGGTRLIDTVRVRGGEGTATVSGREGP